METQNDSPTGIPPSSGPPPHVQSARFGMILAVIFITLIVASLFVVGVLPRLQRDKALAQGVQRMKSDIQDVTVTTPLWVSDGGLNLSGNIQAIQETPINARTTGYIRKLYVDIGSRVKAGELLAEIEAPDVDQQVYQAQAQTDQSKAVVGQAQAQVTQQRASVAQTQAQVSQQRASVEQAKAALVGTEAKLTQAKAVEGQYKAQLAHTVQNLAVQRAALKVADGQLELATVTNNRYQDLYRQGFVARQDVDQAEAGLKAANATKESALASIKAAQADIDAAEQTLISSKALAASAEADVLASEKSLQAAEAALTSSKATVQVAQAGVMAGMKNVQANQSAVASNEANTRHFAAMRSFERVVAPYDGVISARNVEQGTLINAGGQNGTAATGLQSGMLNIARTDIVRIQIEVPQTYIPAIRFGSKAQVTVQEAHGRVFSGVISLRAGALDTLSRTQLVEVHLPNPDNALTPGMYAEVRLTPARPVKALRVPGTALIIDSQGTRVAVVSAENTVHLQTVKLGRDFGTDVEILSGLKGDEKLVNSPSDTLQEGGHIHIAEAPSPVGKKASRP